MAFQKNSKSQALAKRNSDLIAFFVSRLISKKTKYRSFLAQKNKQKSFKNRQRNQLKARLKQLNEKRQKNMNLQKRLNRLEYDKWISSLQLKNYTRFSRREKAFLEHERKSKQYENIRKEAFLLYKKKYQKYQKRQKGILSVRLKTLKSFREKNKMIEKQIPVF